MVNNSHRGGRTLSNRYQIRLVTRCFGSYHTIPPLAGGDHAAPILWSADSTVLLVKAVPGLSYPARRSHGVSQLSLALAWARQYLSVMTLRAAQLILLKGSLLSVSRYTPFMERFWNVL